MKLERRPAIDGIMAEFIEFLRLALPEIDLRAMSLRVYDSEYDNLVLFGQTGFMFPEKRRAVVPVQGTIAGRLYLEGGKKYLMIEQGEYFTDRDLSLAEKEEHVSLLAGSLTYLGRRIGTVQAYTRQSFRQCPEEKLDLIMGHLMEISSRFVRSYLEDEFLLELQEELTGTNPRGGFSRMTAIIAELFNTSGVIIYYRSDDDHVKIIAGYSEENIPPHGLGQEFRISRNGEFNLEYLEEVIRQRKILIFQGEDKRLKSIHAIMHFQKTRSIMVAPIIVEDYVQGFIVVNQSENRPAFRPEEVALIERIALKASQAMTIIRLQRYLASCQASNLVADVIAEIRHSVGNSLPVIANFARMIEEMAGLPPKIQEKARIIRQEAGNLSQQIEVIEKLYVDEQALKKHYFNLVTFLEEIARRWQARFKEAGFWLVLKTDRKQRNVYGQPAVLARALDNLFQNALQAMAPGGTLKVGFRVSKRGNSVITLENPGEISPDILPRIFSAGFTTKKEGTGLGLAMARSDIALHGGELSCQVINGLTVFKIVLPRHRRDE